MILVTTTESISWVMRNASRTARTASEFLPKDCNLAAMQKAVQGCQGCDLYRNATHAVFGEGKKGADLMLVGEQPGDKEDLAGKPFVGPAGHLLDRCLDAAGIDRTKVYVTNAVKHFKWEPRGKLRIHKKPTSLEIAACKPWFDAEVKAVGPKLLVCLGATAAQSLLGRAFRVTQHRGEIFESANHPPILATVHPSSILRAQDDESRERERLEFVEDLKRAAQYLKRA
jgi:uracil-DNA glycosylase family protein